MILYKKDTKGKIRQLEIYAMNGELLQISGLVGGKLVPHNKLCTAKNVGRANETSITQQAELEMDALIKKKLREGYFTTVAEAKTEEIVLPMLAHSYEKHSKKVDWDNAFVQPKLDGMRCLAFIKDGKVKLMSRKGVEITTMNHIALSLSGLDDGIIDGELYTHGETFQKNMSLIKKYREGESEKIKFHIYDRVENTRFIDRHCYLGTDNIRWNKYLSLVLTIQVKSEDEMWKRHSMNLEAGYEGTMLRHGIKGYKKNGRADQLLKVKDFIDETFVVTNVLPMEVYTDQGILVCEMMDGRSFKATPKMSHKEREELLINKNYYIGETAEVRFFEWTDCGLPRFPICVGFRLDK